LVALDSSNHYVDLPYCIPMAHFLHPYSVLRWIPRESRLGIVTGSDAALDSTDHSSYLVEL
jgi:hypothetical protein